MIPSVDEVRPGRQASLSVSLSRTPLGVVASDLSVSFPGDVGPRNGRTISTKFAVHVGGRGSDDHRRHAVERGSDGGEGRVARRLGQRGLAELPAGEGRRRSAWNC